MLQTVPSSLLLLASIFCTVFGQSGNVSLTTKKGPIVGYRYNPNPETNVSFDAFRGIPYGQIPERFQLAEARSAWTEPLVTQADGPLCPQPSVDTFQEDCLFLNVFTPVNASTDGSLIPVMVYIYGSAFTSGSSKSRRYGPDFLVNQTVILVTMNFRLGAPGFLTLGSKVAPGNLGLHDTLLALQWVQDEISTFGGDPARVTLFGHSSGSEMVQMHYLSSLSTDLFLQAIAQSGSVLAVASHYESVAEGVRRAKALAKGLGCDTTQNDSAILTCLQAADISDIANYKLNDLISNYDNISGNYGVFLPVLDTYLIAEKPFFNDTLENLMAQALGRSKPLITGTASNDGMVEFTYEFWRSAEDNLAAFIPYEFRSKLSSKEITSVANSIKSRYFPDDPDLNRVQSLVNLYSDYKFIHPSIQITQYFANVTYSYMFGYYGPWPAAALNFAKYKIEGVTHGAELLYLFYNGTEDLSNCPTNLPNIIIKNQMVQFWTTFAKTGIPDPNWPTVAEGGYLMINDSLTLIPASDFEDRYYNFWEKLTTTADNSASALNLGSAAVFVISLLLSFRAL